LGPKVGSNPATSTNVAGFCLLLEKDFFLFLLKLYTRCGRQIPLRLESVGFSAAAGLGPSSKIFLYFAAAEGRTWLPEQKKNKTRRRLRSGQAAGIKP